MTLFDTCGPTQTPEDIDIDALREKYSQERDKRLRPEGATQYLELKDDFAEFAEVDPHTPVTPRTPINEDVEVAVLGGGIAGLLAGAYLKKAGVDDVHVIEMGGDFGGVWYWNRFPGIQCDNDAYCYIPMLEELDFLPSKKFADGAEIFEHCKRIGKHFGLYDGAHLLHAGSHGAVGRGHQALAADHQPWRRHPGPLRGHDAGLLQPARSCPASQASGISRGTSFTRRVGTMTTPAATRTVGCTSWRTSASRSSEPAQQACSWFRISVETLSICTSFSEPRRRWTCAATSRRIRSGRLRCSLAGRRSASSTSTAGHRSATEWSSMHPTWSATSGPSLAAT